MKQVGLYFLFIILLSCNRQVDNSETLSNLLEKTFADSKSAMSDFVNKWEKDSVELLSKNPTDLEVNFIGIYKEVFNPFDYDNFGLEDFTNWTPYIGTKYIVIQSEMPYKIVDRVDTLIEYYNFVDTLKHFHPRIKFENVTTLYLTKDYQNTFKMFLGDPENETERQLFREKRKFLDNTFKMTFGYNWRVILTHPIIDGICISTDFKVATVDFTILQSGLRSYLVKENDKWTIKSTKTTWVE
jgi:hypothetical protein